MNGYGLSSFCVVMECQECDCGWIGDVMTEREYRECSRPRGGLEVPSRCMSEGSLRRGVRLPAPPHTVPVGCPLRTSRLAIWVKSPSRSSAGAALCTAVPRPLVTCQAVWATWALQAIIAPYERLELTVGRQLTVRGQAECWRWRCRTKRAMTRRNG